MGDGRSGGGDAPLVKASDEEVDRIARLLDTPIPKADGDH
jgi:hypothetical protein